MKKTLFDPGKDGPLRDLGLLVLRLGAGALMVPHGWGKLQNFGERAGSFPDPIGIGSELSMALTIFAELVCGVLVTIGLFGRWATVPPMIAMAVAFFVVHAGDPMGEKELALRYLLGYLGLFFTGPGRYSVDAMIRGKR